MPVSHFREGNATGTEESSFQRQRVKIRHIGISKETANTHHATKWPSDVINSTMTPD